MPNLEGVEAMLDKAHRAGDLTKIIIVAKDEQGRIRYYTDQGDVEKMISMLERAKNKLARNLDP